MKWITLLLLVSTLAGGPSVPQPTLSDLLEQGLHMELAGDYKRAEAIYAKVLLLKPDHPIINYKMAEMAIIQGDSGKAAKRLVRTLELLQADPTTPLQFKLLVCDLLMGRIPYELGMKMPEPGWISPTPFNALTPDERRHVVDIADRRWLFGDKIDEAWFEIGVGNKNKAITFLREGIVTGAWERAQYVLMSKGFDPSERLPVVQAWQREAEKSGDPNLWLATLDGYRRLEMLDRFRGAFPSALTKIKGQPPKLKQLAAMVEGMKWADGEKQIAPLLPAVVRPADAREAFAALDKALDAGNRDEVGRLAVYIASDFAGNASALASRDRIRAMLKLGWMDLVEKLIQPEAWPVGLDTQQEIMADAASSPVLFDYWMKRFTAAEMNRSHRTDTTRSMLASGASTCLDRREPEKAIWLMEQSLRYFPDDVWMLSQLASAYTDAGYAHRALPPAREALLVAARKGEGSNIGVLWDAAKRADQFEETTNWLWNTRSALSISTYVGIAGRWKQDGKPEEALRWIDSALDMAEQNGWTGDAASCAYAWRAFQHPEMERLDPAVEQRIKRTAGLYSASTSELRIQCLLATHQEAKALQVLGEAQKLYPDYPFRDRIEGLPRDVEADSTSETKRHEAELRGESTRDSVSPYRHLIMLADELRTKKKVDDATPAITEEWQSGLTLATDLLNKRISAIMPFTAWIHSRTDNKSPIYKHVNADAIMDVADAISATGDKSLAGSFYLAAMLTAPKSVELSELQTMGQVMDHWGWNAAVSEADRVSLRGELARTELNETAVMALTFQPTQAAWQFGWVRSVDETQDRSASGVMNVMGRGLDGADRAQIRKWLTKLSATTQWTWVLPELPIYLAQRLAGKGMSKEGIELLEIARDKAEQYTRQRVAVELVRMTGKTTTPSGDGAKDSAKWLEAARTQVSVGRMPDARVSALKAIETAQTPRAKADALSTLANADPSGALKLISKMLPDFLVADPQGGDPPQPLLTVGDALYTIASKDRSLAKSVAPLIDRAGGFSKGMRLNLAQRRAIVDFWVGRTETGVAALLPAEDTSGYVFQQAIGTLVRADIPEPARKALRDGIRSYLSGKKPTLSMLGKELGWARELNWGIDRGTGKLYSPDRIELSPEGVNALADLLSEYVDTVHGIVPEVFRSSLLRKLASACSETEPPAWLSDPWLALTEKAFRKAVVTDEDAKSISKSLRDWLKSYENCSQSKTMVYSRLRALAGSLERR